MVILIGVIAFVLVRCGNKQGSREVLSQGIENTEQSAGEKNDSVISVEVKEVKQGTLTTYTSIVGEAEAFREVELIPRLQEEVEKINVQIGDTVKKGDILLELNSDDSEIELKQAEASLAAAEANLQEALNGTREEEIIQLKADLKSAKSDLEIAETNYERYKELYEKEFISKQTFEEYLNKYIVAQSSYESDKQSLKIAESGSTAEELKSLQAQVDQAEASLSSAKLELSRTRVKAPIAGVISALGIEIGEKTTTASSILTISQLDKIKIKAYVSQKIVNKLKVDDSVVLYFSAIDDIFTAKIQSISPVADETKKSFPVEIIVDNPAHLIKAGMYAEINLKTNQVNGELVIPQSAVIEEDGEKYVYIINNNKAVKLKIETGVSSQEEIVVLSGLDEGDMIVYTGAEYLKDGSSVKIVGQGGK